MTTTSEEEPAFGVYDPALPLRVYRGHLPHWRQEGVLYFVTFRLADSIPRNVSASWAEERKSWLAVHGLIEGLTETERRVRYEAIPQGVREAFEREEARRFFVELDRCHGACVLRSQPLSDLVRDTLVFFDGQRLRCGDCVVMPNHVHWIVAPTGDYSLENILQSVKSFSARRVNAMLGRCGTLWQKESFDHIVRNQGELDRIRQYVERNPGQARLGTGEYRYYRCDWL